MSVERINSRWAETHGDDRLAYGERFIALDQPSRPLWKLPACLMGLCGHRQQSDERGAWGECTTCGRVTAFVDSETLRRCADAQAVPSCTCHPDDRPLICQRKYANSECIAARAALAKATAPKGEA